MSEEIKVDPKIGRIPVRKKDNKKGLGSVPNDLQWLSGQSSKKRTAELNVKDGHSRITFIANKELYAKLKNAAYWDRVPVNTYLNKAIASFIKDKNTSEIPPLDEVE